MPNLGMVFVTGLLAGGVGCVAVQGGLLTTAVATGADALDVLVFLATKLIAYTGLGLVLGLLGKTLQFNPLMTAALQGTVAIYMLGVALAMLDIHPFFRRFMIQTPAFIGRYLRRTAKTGGRFAPAVLGAATVFIPCGTTQAMMALAVASGNPVWGALILAVFVLGTSPLFFLLGLTITKLGEVARINFTKIAAVTVMAAALFSLNSAVVLAGSPVTAQKVWANISCEFSFCKKDDLISGQKTPANELTITFLSNRYEVDNPVVKAGSNVRINLVNKGGFGCIQSLNFPALGIAKIVPPGSTDSINIKVPDKAGKLAYSCSMGMYTGELTIIN